MSESTPVSVLVVDDHAPFRVAAAAVIARANGFSCVGEAADGEEAVRLVGELRPRLVLMDVRMPGTDGVSAARVMREQWPDTRVILCSTYDVADLSDVGLAEALTEGIAYVPKEELAPATLRALWDSF